MHFAVHSIILFYSMSSTSIKFLNPFLSKYFFLTTVLSTLQTTGNRIVR